MPNRPRAQAASVFQQIGGAGNAYSRFCHLGGDLTGLE